MGFLGSLGFFLGGDPTPGKILGGPRKDFWVFSALLGDFWGFFRGFSGDFLIFRGFPGRFLGCFGIILGWSHPREFFAYFGFF